MSRPVQYNNTVKFAGIPEGYMGDGFMATNFEKVVSLARKNSIWPLPFATSCCGIEFMATAASHYDIARFGAENRVGIHLMGFNMTACVIPKNAGPQHFVGFIQKRRAMHVAR